MEHHGCKGEGLIVKGKSSEKGSCGMRKSREGEKVRMTNGDMYDVVGMGEVRIKLHIGSEMLDVKHVSGLKKNSISLGTLNKLGYKYRCRGGVIKISKGALVVMKKPLQKSMYVLQGKVLTTAVECAAPEEKYLESLRDGGDLLETNKVEKHRLHTHSKALKFLISNVTSDVSALVKQIENTSRGEVE
ncbi:hypothetical protein CRG98_005334 [Punica granatum]|uniref:Retrovirus-related Pol polyprotein from transposon TNT 1-94-like beta-barrel domain-containing protein n=1 Tax=Punica granatum TaxID=22663 RepID=A0A2I0L0M8_PUNGR|nr:hypothetical protein CRG98_005334 [Punica granatum]